MPDSKARENAARVRGHTKRQRKPKQKGDADHSVSQQGVGKVADGILGRDYGQATFERHAALLGDPHLTGPRYANQRADIAKQLQKDYGNRYVQRVISRISERRTEADQTDSSVGSLRGMTDVVQRTPIDSLIQRETHGVGDTTYLVLDTVPGTRFEVVRTNWHPWSERKIYDTASGTVLAMSLTSDEGTNIRAAFQGLIAQGGHDLNGLMEDIDKAAGNGVPVNVSIGRLGSITQYIRDVVLARLAADRADLKARGLLSATVPAAFDEAFQSIEIPGSDPHKGGQVVIFVNYNAGGDTSERIVYKPGDLRVDQFLSGSDPASIASRIGGGMASYQILTKEVAGHGVDERLKQYGYMQFVESGQPQSTDDVLGIYKGLRQGIGCRICVRFEGPPLRELYSFAKRRFVLGPRSRNGHLYRFRQHGISPSAYKIG